MERQTLGPVVVGPGLFKIMVSCPLIPFTVSPVSYLRMIDLWYFFNTACLYIIRLGGTKVLSVDLNKIFLLLFVDTFGTAPNRHSMHP